MSLSAKAIAEEVFRRERQVGNQPDNTQAKAEPIDRVIARRFGKISREENADEYTVDCYVSTVSGRVACAVPRLRISTSGGEVDRTETRRIPTLMQQSEHILTELKFRGPVTLQFLHDKATDRYLLMEINPRLGGGVVCSIHAGADIAEMILRESRGEEARRIDDWRDRALMTRYFAEVMF